MIVLIKENLMPLDTAMIPQADLIRDVARVPEAVNQGITTTAAIATYLGDKGPRQGRYYLRAARILGFVTDDAASSSVMLTTYGHVFLNLDHTDQQRFLQRRLAQCEPMKTIIEALQTRGGLTKSEIAHILQSCAPLSENTAGRRAATMCAWLRDLGIASWKQDRLAYMEIPIPITDFLPTSAPDTRIEA